MMTASPASSEQVLNGTAAPVGEKVGEHLGLPGRWLSVDDAAVALGINPSTVRRRIREHKLPSKRIERPQGHILRIFVADDQLSTSR